MKIIVIFFIQTALFNSNISQNQVCGISNIKTNAINCLNNYNSTNYKSNKLIKTIVEKIAVNANTFQYISCDHIQNAFAMIHPISKNRIVMYDNNYFSTITDNDYWFKVFVLAHEIAHHLNGHTILLNNVNESYISSQKRELDCDYFAGHILYKLGAKESEILKIFEKLPDANSEISSHPKNYKRLDFALKGFNDELNRMQSELEYYSENIKDNLQNEKTRYTIKEIFRNIEEYNKTNEIKFIQIADNLINQSLLNNDPKFEKVIFYIDNKLGRFEKTFNYAKKQYLENVNEDNCIKLLEIMTHAFIKDNLVDDISNIEFNNPKINFLIGLYYHQNENTISAKKHILKAYENIKKSEESLLKSDILIAYARTIFESNLYKNDFNNFTLSKIKFLEAKKILDKYPNDDHYRFYYNSLIYHLGTINFLENNCYGVEKYFTELLDRLKNNNNESNEHHIYKSYVHLSECSENSSNKFKTLQYYTSAIQSCKNEEHLCYFYSKRAEFYQNENEDKLAKQDYEKACNLGDKRACNILTTK